MNQVRPNFQNTKYQVAAKQKPDKREYSIDILRGIAVLLMISAHVLFFFHNGESSFLKFGQKIGDTFAFVTFLFISGAVSFILFELKKSKIYDLKTKIFKRILKLLIGFYITAIISNFKNYDFTSDKWIFQILEILIFKNVPGFTEFMIPFIAFSFIQVLFPKIFQFIGKNLFFSITLGILLYVLGFALYFIKVDEPLVFYKMLLSGEEDYYRFPLLQYAPVFLISLNVGNFLINEKNVYIRRKRFFQVFFFFLILTLITYFTEPFSSFSQFNDFERWPPAPGFILMGLTFSFFTLFFVIKRAQKDTMPYLYKVFNLIGKDSFLYFVAHIIILQIYDILIGFKSSNIIIVGLLSLLAFILTSYFVKLIKNLTSTFSTVDIPKDIALTPGEQRKAEKNKQMAFKLMFLLLTLIILLSGVVFFSFDQNQEVKAYERREDTINVEIFSKKEEKLPIWWNYDYAYFRKISIFNQGLFSDINKGTFNSIDLNHQELIQNNKSLVNANDLRIVYLEGENYIELQTQVEKPATSETKIYFKVVNDIKAGTSDKNYYLYYGNKLAGNAPRLTESISQIAETQKTILATEKQGALSIGVDRYWLLKEQSIRDVSTLTVKMNINNKPFGNDVSADYTYQIVGTPLTGKLFATGDKNIFESKVDVSALKPGIYQIQAVGKTSDTEIISPKESFVVSYPLYVTWTMDWEGFDVKDTFLNSIDRISSQYGIPVSHFFNPRIYLALSGSRSQYLTNWVKERKNSRGDSIDLHLHMFYDMAEAAGVDPYNTGGVDYEGNPIEPEPRPQWGSPLKGGYDVLMSSYNYDDTVKLLQWATQKFEENGLGTPKGFRAGGWFLDIENMVALEDQGFLYDSSGRTGVNFGGNKATSPWSLSSTTQPYRPSREDQNSPNPPPNFAVWEFPNNGADSYAFSGEDMIKRFNDNYSGGYLEEKRLVTYLSHPEWFNIDEPKLDLLFTYINQFLHKNDQGPVIYINLNEAYKSWT